jgi:hypothetical protein
MEASMHDSILTSHYSKAVYRLWRPETAIAHADLDNNPATPPEAGWTPLIPTPPYPAYSSNMTCIGSGASRMLGMCWGAIRRPLRRSGTPLATWLCTPSRT